MKDSIIHGLTAAAAGILFCLAVIFLLLELHAVSGTEDMVNRQYGIVTGKEAGSYGRK